MSQDKKPEKKEAPKEAPKTETKKEAKTDIDLRVKLQAAEVRCHSLESMPIAQRDDGWEDNHKETLAEIKDLSEKIAKLQGK